jgi:hypothetical protein
MRKEAYAFVDQMLRYGTSTVSALDSR